MEQKDASPAARQFARASSLPSSSVRTGSPGLGSPMSPTASGILQYRSSSSNAFSPKKLGARPRSATPSKQGATPSSAAAKDAFSFVLQANPSSSVVARRPDAARQAQPHILHLDRCNLSACCALEDEQQLRVLTYQHNNIRRISNVSKLSNLVCLDLYANALDSISGLDDLPSLRVLILGKNYIPKITNLMHLAKLDVLDLHQNLVEDMSALQTLTSLRVLNLSGNRVRTLANLKSLTRLTELNLSRNFLTTLSLQHATGASSCSSAGGLNHASSSLHSPVAGKHTAQPGISFGECHVPTANGSSKSAQTNSALPPSIVSLQLSHNRLSSLTELTHMSPLTSIQDLCLTGNPVSKIHPPQIWRLLVLLHCSPTLATLDTQQVGSTERQILGDANTMSTLHNIMQQYGLPKVPYTMHSGTSGHSPINQPLSNYKSPQPSVHPTSPQQLGHCYHPSNGGWVNPAQVAMTSILAKMQAAGLGDQAESSAAARVSARAQRAVQSTHEPPPILNSLDDSRASGEDVASTSENGHCPRKSTTQTSHPCNPAAAPTDSMRERACGSEVVNSVGIGSTRQSRDNLSLTNPSTSAPGSYPQQGVPASSTPRGSRPRPRSAPRRLSISPFQGSLPTSKSNNPTPRSQNTAAPGSSRYNPCLQLQTNPSKSRSGQQTSRASAHQIGPRHAAACTHESYLTPLGLALPSAQTAGQGMAGGEEGDNGNEADYPLPRSQSDGLSTNLASKLVPQSNGMDRQKSIPSAWKPQEESSAQSTKPGNKVVIRLTRPEPEAGDVEVEQQAANQQTASTLPHQHESPCAVLQAQTTNTVHSNTHPDLALFLPGTSMLVDPQHLQIWGNAMHALLDPVVQSIQHLSLIHVHISLVHQQLDTVRALSQLNTLTLQHNGLDSPGLLQPLSRLTSLREINIVDNPVSQVPHFQLYMLSLIPSLRVINQELVPQSSIDLVVQTLKIGNRAKKPHQAPAGRSHTDINTLWRNCTISDASSSDEQVEDEDEEEDNSEERGLKLFVDSFLNEATEGAQKYLDRLQQFEKLWPNVVKAYIIEGYNGTF